MAGHPQLTAGAVTRAESNDTAGQPIVQCVDMKQMPNAQGGSRWRILISDGARVMQAMLATQLNPRAESGEVRASPATPPLTHGALEFCVPRR